MVPDPSLWPRSTGSGRSLERWQVPLSQKEFTPLKLVKELMRSAEVGRGLTVPYVQQTLRNM